MGRALWIGQVNGSNSLDRADYGVELCGLYSLGVELFDKK